MSNISILQRHPLKREGTNRVSILLQALSPSYFKLDDRSMQDIIVVAHRYAQNLSYFNEHNQPEGDWSAFWEIESLTYLAVLASLDTDELRKKYDDIDVALAEALENFNPSTGKPNPAPGLYRDLLNTLFDMAKGLETMYGKLVQIKHPMQNMLLKIIKRDNQCDFEELQGALQRLVALHKKADDKLKHERYNVFYAPDDRWGIPNRKHYDLIKPDLKLTREKLRELFITFYNTYLMIVHRGQQAFDEELALMNKPENEVYRIVEPHISLFLAFLRLFRHAQDSLNELTQKQLDYYYENILCLHRRPAEPDHVHLIYTLAKNFDRELIEKGTLMIGGKDKNGQPMYYETLQDWVVTKAQVAELKTVFVPQKLSFNNAFVYKDFNKSLLAHAFLPDGNTSHRPFGDDGAYEELELGFVIASPQLWLQEGNRWIEISIDNISDQIFNAQQGTLTDNLGVAVATKAGWGSLIAPALKNKPGAVTYDNKFFTEADFTNLAPIAPVKTDNHVTPPPLQASYAVYQDTTAKKLYIQIFLPADYDAIEPIEGNSMTTLPSVKVYLKKGALVSFNNPYENLLHKNTSKISISVRAEGVSKSLIIQTDAGVTDGTQQVLPFGATASKGAKIYLGSREAFLKKLNNLKFNIDWVGGTGKDGDDFIIEQAPSGEMDVAFLKDNVFGMQHFTLPPIPPPLPFSILNGPTKIRGTLTYDFHNLERSKQAYQFERFDPSIRRGFFSFTFKGDFGHSDFAERLALASIKESHNPTVSPGEPNLPNPPYTPTFNSIKMDYISANQEMEFGVDEFFYIHPFDGFEKRTHFEKTKRAGSTTAQVQAFSLLSDYTQFNGATKIDGHLMIGLEGLATESNLSLLVQTSEGSEKNADMDIPRLLWSYLKKDNVWAPLSPLKILLDSSRSLTRSGVIQIAVPEDISSEGNTLLNPKLLWLRVLAVESEGRSAAALPDLLNLRTQVVEARLRLDEGLEPIHLTEGQPSSTISKLAISRSAIKKIEQPAPTFWGRVAELSGLSFYQRISERLRHRNRAITAWDYEHLLLSKFPEVATAKCINHTQYKITPATELAPGFVTIALIPDLRKRAGTSLENPRFPKGDLDEIRDYLNKYANLFLNEEIGDHKYLQVVNPQYEHLILKIKVQFKPGVDEAFYKLKLSDDLRDHIAPWLNNPNAAPVFGRMLRRSAIIRFVEDLLYIDFVKEMVVQRSDGTSLIIKGELIRPDAAHGILTTDIKHSVNEL